MAIANPTLKITLAYTRNRNGAKQVIELVQSNDVRRTTAIDPAAALHAIESLLHNHSNREQQRRWFDEGTFHQTWNERRVAAGERLRFDVEIEGKAVSVQGLRVDDEAIFIGATMVKDTGLGFSALNLSEAEVRDALEALVVLSGNDELIGRHQRSDEAAREERHRGGNAG